MKKWPFEQYIATFRNSNQESKDLLKYVFEKSDNISLWIIGLAIGGISIFANNIADIQKSIPTESLKPILVLLVISVSSGIIYRALYLYFFVVQNQISIGINVALVALEDEDDIVDTVSLLNGQETFKQLTNRLMDGFNIDVSYLVSTYEKLDKDSKSKLYNDIVKLYEERVKLAQDDEQEALETIAEIYSSFFGVKKEKFLAKMQNNSLGRRYKLTLYFTMFFYLTYITSFIIALLSFVVAI